MSNKLQIRNEAAVSTIRTGENIEKLLKINGISRYRLSEMLNVTQQAIKKWVDGDNLPSIDHVIEMMQLFDVCFEDIVAVC